MCVLSQVLDYGKRQPQEYWNASNFRLFTDMIDLAKKYDTATGQPDCEDPDKSKFLEELMVKFKDIETKTKAPTRQVLRWLREHSEGKLTTGQLIDLLTNQTS